MVIDARRVDADDAGGDAGQHGFGEAAALVDQVLGLQDLVALRLQLLQHLVEGVAQRGDVAVGSAHRNGNVEIAGRHLVGGADQLADRPHQPVGDGDAGPDRRQHDDQRQAEIEQRKGDLRGAAVAFEAAILVGIGGDDLARLDHFRVDQPASCRDRRLESRRSLTIAPTMLRPFGLDQHRLPLAALVVFASHSGGGCGMSKSARVLAAMMTEPSSLISAAWASSRAMACWLMMSRKPVRSRL